MKPPILSDDERPIEEAYGYRQPIQGGALEAFEELICVLQPIDDLTRANSARRGGMKQKNRNYKHWEE